MKGACGRLGVDNLPDRASIQSGGAVGYGKRPAGGVARWPRLRRAYVGCLLCRPLHYVLRSPGIVLMIWRLFTPLGVELEDPGSGWLWSRQSPRLDLMGWPDLDRCHRHVAMFPSLAARRRVVILEK